MFQIFSCSVADLEGSEDDFGATVFDKYDIGEILGSGAFGNVHQCTRLQDGEACAVKVIDLHSPGAQSLEGVLTAADEAMILQRLQHPNIIQVFDMFESDRFLYVAMELVEGGELFKAISRPDADVRESDLAATAAALLGALDYLHYNLIVHRDVKAENILLTELPESGGHFVGSSMKLIDFGLSAQLQFDVCSAAGPEEVKQLNLVCGTPHYCAPEIWSSGMPGVPDKWREEYGMYYGPKVDVWATGVLLYLALFGCYPYNGKEPAELMKSSCSADSAPSYSLAPAAGRSYSPSEEAVGFLDTLLAKNQEERPMAGDALAAPWLNGSRKRRLNGRLPPQLRASAYEEMVRVGNQRRPRVETLRAREAALQAEIARARNGT